MGRILPALAAVTAASLGFACEHDQCESAVKQFYSAPSSVWARQLVSLPLNDRFNVYVCGLKQIHPAPLGLATAVARGDGPVLETMEARLQTSSDPEEIVGAANVMVEYSRIHPERVCRTGRTASILRAAEAKIEEEHYREYFQRISSRLCRGYSGVSL